MSIFQLKPDNLSQIKEMPFKLEREIQNLVEKNLGMLLGLEFVKSEFTISGTVQQLRIDTLAFDAKSKAFVIIEYKQDKSFSVVDQGYAYLSVMLNNKADFILEYNESSGKVLKKADVDWSQSRVIFISQAFTPYQKEAINFKDLPIALWEIKQFSNQTISFEEIRKLNATESIKTVSAGNSAVDSVSKVVVVYTENDRLKDIPEDIFRHFVLPVRGGKENLDTARIVFYKELKERVAACESMEKAALEVNHWCHEHVIYLCHSDQSHVLAERSDGQTAEHRGQRTDKTVTGNRAGGLLPCDITSQSGGSQRRGVANGLRRRHQENQHHGNDGIRMELHPERHQMRNGDAGSLPQCGKVHLAHADRQNVPHDQTKQHGQLLEIGLGENVKQDAAKQRH